MAKRNGSYLAGEAGRKARAFDEMTEAEWVREATGKPMSSAMGRIFATGQAGWYGLDPDHLGASNLIDYYAVDFPGGDERYTTRGGNDQIPHGMHDALPSGTVHLESAVESIRRVGNGPYHLKVAGRNAPVIADYVVLTLPFTALRNVDLDDLGLSAAKQRAINQLGMGTNSKLHLQFDQIFYDFDKWSGGVTRCDDPRWSTWDSGNTDSKTGSRKYGLMTIYSGGRVGAGYPTSDPHGVAPRVIVDTALRHLNQMIPGTRAAYSGKAWLDFWVRDRWVKGSYAAFLPEQTTSFMGMMGKPEGRVHFAGEHTSTYSQGFLNGGTESGSRVAGEILDELGLAYPTGLAKAFKQQQRYQPVYPWN
jgi:monoamine oxidase